jgi:hypothetical protein
MIVGAIIVHGWREGLPSLAQWPLMVGAKGGDRWRDDRSWLAR